MDQVKKDLELLNSLIEQVNGLGVLKNWWNWIRYDLHLRALRILLRMLKKSKPMRKDYLTEMYPEEEDRLTRMDNMLSEILEILRGDTFTKTPGLIDVVAAHGLQIGALEQNKKYLKVLLIGIGIGALLFGLIIGSLTVKDLVSALK